MSRTLWWILGALALAGALRVEGQQPAAASGQPILTMQQQIELASTQQVLVVELHKLQSLPGFATQAVKVEAAQQKLQGLEEKFCQAKDGKRYRLAHDNGVWACREQVAAAVGGNK